MNKELISVIMPTKNRGHLISQSIRSIINQTYENWELIIIDDNSDKADKTEEIIKSFDNKQINFYPLPPEYGQGIATARNYGNFLAKGNYVAVMDSDDIALPERLKLTIEKFKSTKADVVYARMLHWYADENRLEKRKVEFNERIFDLDHFKKYNFIPHSTVSYTKLIANLYPYNSAFKKSADYDLLARLAITKCNIQFIDKVLLHYRIHDGSISKLNKHLNYGDIVRKHHGWLN
jgi:glycosyltransferase involved in cell wall biosynthesis